MRRSFFLFGTGLSICAATLILTIIGTRRVIQEAPTITTNTPFEVWYFIFAFLLLTALMVLLLRVVHGRFLFSLFFSLALFVGVWFFADIFFPSSAAVIFSAA